MSSNKASRKNESGTDCQPENSQHTTGCFILTIFRPHLTPPLPRVPTGVKAKRCCGSFRLACHFVPCHRQNFFFFFFFFSQNEQLREMSAKIGTRTWAAMSAATCSLLNVLCSAVQGHGASCVSFYPPPRVQNFFLFFTRGSRGKDDDVGAI